MTTQIRTGWIGTGKSLADAYRPAVADAYPLANYRDLTGADPTKGGSFAAVIECDETTLKALATNPDYPLVDATDLRRALLIIQAADQKIANVALASVGKDLFGAGLSPAGTEPATHYWATALVSQDTWLAVQKIQAGFKGSVLVTYDLASDPGAPDRWLKTLGLQRILPAALKDPKAGVK